MPTSSTTLRSFSLVFCAAQTRKTPTAKRPSKPPKTLFPTPPPTTLTTSTTTTTNVTTPSLPLKKVLVPIGFGTEEMEAVILVDVLRRAGANVTLASVEPQLEVEASSGTKLVADTPISDCSNEIFDLIALPGGMPGSARLRDCKILQEITRKQAKEERLYGAISAAPAVTLLPWGLLKRKQTTCHPAFVDKLPTFWAVKTNLQVSKELTTSRGPGTAFEFSISLVNQLFGEAIAKDVAELLLMKAADENPRKEEYNEVEWNLDHIPCVLIPIANGCEEIEVVSIIDILRRAKVNVTVASVEKSMKILASRGTKIVADKLISQATDSIYDMIILPGGNAGAERLHKSRVLKKLLKEQELGGRMYGAICSSPLILHRQGLLKDKRATAHPSIISELSEEVIDGSRVVIDGKLITSRGLASSIDFALAIVSKFFGDARARSVAEGLVFEYPRKKQ